MADDCVTLCLNAAFLFRFCFAFSWAQPLCGRRSRSRSLKNIRNTFVHWASANEQLESSVSVAHIWDIVAALESLNYRFIEIFFVTWAQDASDAPSTGRVTTTIVPFRTERNKKLIYIRLSVFDSTDWLTQCGLVTGCVCVCCLLLATWSVAWPLVLAIRQIYILDSQLIYILRFFSHFLADSFCFCHSSPQFICISFYVSAQSIPIAIQTKHSPFHRIPPSPSLCACVFRFSLRFFSFLSHQEILSKRDVVSREE